ncbi:helix-turn-helix domain-containing protein [Catenuloplanes indicus]|uniref:Transcriptional regulator with XRE-family HTH domain n=1 Tax=Catenuloplanes indicus TaxID=137267 RepID=A0AAE3W8N0_9ACTN|nr:helix-turn-helix transcriptional regulator [Catenuloplanes indicus]MDQ0371544.1 transcriptional regulator with XRE-family HTH domain [Catenuloplanes indicus]
MTALPPVIPVRALREALGLTLDDVVARIKDQGEMASKSGLSNFEAGVRQASPRLALAYCRALGVDRHHISQAREQRALVAASTPALDAAA